MDFSPGKQPKHTAEIIIVIGYVLFLFLFIVICIFLFYLTFSQNAPPAPNILATSLPALTPSSSIPSDYQPGTFNIFKDNFDDFQNNWGDNQEPSTYEIKDGKLYFKSRDDGKYAIAHCGRCPILNEPYYLQADLVTDKLVDEGFGIVFKFLYGRADFYLFEINPAANKYYLYHHSSDDWSLRMSGRTDQIQPYPAVNRLGLYINKGSLEFYINGKIVDTYHDTGTSFQSGQFGFYVNDAGFKLIVDNLTVDKAGGK